jgi:HlyD family secretion protein
VKNAFKLILALILVAVTLCIVAANFAQGPDFFQFRWKINAEPPLEVKLTPVSAATVRRTVEAPGKVEADEEVKISSQVMGRIVELPFKEGDPVHKNDLLVQLDRVQYDADVKSAGSRVERLKASIELADADLIKSRRDLERTQRLYSGRAMSQVELVDLQTTLQKDMTRLAMARSDLIEAQAALTRAQEDLKHTTIRSTLDGIVSQVLAKEGEMVVVGTMNNAGTVILSISNLNTRVVRARVDENSVALVREGQPAIVHFQNNARLQLPGRVKRISPKGTKGNGAAIQASDNEAAIFETIIELMSPPPEVRLGMTASVEIQVEERAASQTIPTQAVLHRRARDLPAHLVEQANQDAARGPGLKDPTRRYHQVVYVNDNGKASCRLVTTGISDESRVEILSGLDPNQSVVAGPYRVFDKLKEGRPVMPMTETEN